MFSGVWRETSFSWYRLVGVEPDGKELILDDRRYIQPFDQSRLHLAMVRLAQGADAPQQIQTAVANWFCWWRTNRK